jgi:hypothetical protein
LAVLGQGGQHHGRQDGNNGDDRQQFDYGEGKGGAGLPDLAATSPHRTSNVQLGIFPNRLFTEAESRHISFSF